MLTPALDFQLILKFENGTAKRQSPELCIVLLLLRQIIEDAEARPCKLPIGL
jgi:hypothetical protein